MIFHPWKPVESREKLLIPRRSAQVSSVCPHLTHTPQTQQDLQCININVDSVDVWCPSDLVSPHRDDSTAPSLGDVGGSMLLRGQSHRCVLLKAPILLCVSSFTSTNLFITALFLHRLVADNNVLPTLLVRMSRRPSQILKQVVYWYLSSPSGSVSLTGGPV